MRYKTLGFNWLHKHSVPLKLQFRWIESSPQSLTAYNLNRYGQVLNRRQA